MKPYSQRRITHDEKIFNYRLCRARRVVENVFGILASRFRVFLQPIAVAVEKVDAIVLASCALHNFLRRKSKKQYVTETCVDQEDTKSGTVISGEWRQIGNLLELERIKSTNASNTAETVRDSYKKFYNTVGKISRLIN